MSNARTTDLGDIEPARSRHAGRRSALAANASVVAVGTATGDVRAFERNSTRERWRADTDPDRETSSIVSAAICGETLVVGERSPAGRVRGYDLDNGEHVFAHDTAEDIGDPAKQTRFFLPFVVDIVTDGDALYVAARRYEREDGTRNFESVVYCFDPDGIVRWRYRTDASPISLDVSGDRLGVAYNRCPGDHQHGLVVLDAATGEVRWRWDPGTEGQRRVGDVSLRSGGVVVTSHGDYRGYGLDSSGSVSWTAELATTTEVGDEVLYAYPNHVHATEESVVFVTGTTYAQESRETEGRHPLAHTAFGYAGGEQQWTADIGGFAHGVATDENRVAVPSAQAFRERDPDGHGLSVFDGDGRLATTESEGIVTAATVDGNSVAFVEEPVSYHDSEQTHGRYRLHAETVA